MNEDEMGVGEEELEETPEKFKEDDEADDDETEESGGYEDAEEDEY